MSEQQKPPVSRREVRAPESPSSRRGDGPEVAPEVSFSEAPAGRETLAAIADAGVDFPRREFSTRHYGDRISNAPGAMSPGAARALDDQPEIEVSLRPAGRETQALLDQELEREAPEIEVSVGEPGSGGSAAADLPLGELSVEQLCSFVVRAPLTALADPERRWQFVAERLLARLPVAGLDGVSRVEVQPGRERGTLLVSVWCAVD